MKSQILVLGILFSQTQVIFPHDTVNVTIKTHVNTPFDVDFKELEPPSFDIKANKLPDPRWTKPKRHGIIVFN